MFYPSTFQRERKTVEMVRSLGLGYQDSSAIGSLIIMLCNLEKFKGTQSGPNLNMAAYVQFPGPCSFQGHLLSLPWVWGPS